MVMHFSHNKSQKETLDEIRILLKKEGFTVTKYAPEDGFMLTDYKVFNWGTGKRLLSVSVHVHDKVTINGMGKMDIPVSDIGNGIIYPLSPLFNKTEHPPTSVLKIGIS